MDGQDIYLRLAKSETVFYNSVLSCPWILHFYWKLRSEDKLDAYIAWFSMGAFHFWMNQWIDSKKLAQYKLELAAAGLKAQYFFLGIFLSTGYTKNKQKGRRPVSLSLKHYQFKPTAREKTAHTNKLINLVRLGFNEVRP